MSTSEEVKEWLLDFREQRRELETMFDRLEELTARADSPRSPVVDGMPHSGSRAPDRIGLVVAQLEELRNETEDLAQEVSKKRHEIEELVKHITGHGFANRRAVIRLRYVDGGSWDQVTFWLFGNREDFIGKEDTYLRRVHKLHASALKELAECLPVPDLEGLENEKETEDKK